MSRKPFYISTAISYPNGEPHIGHAYEFIATDAIARFFRLDGYDVRFLTGTDEHGLKMQQTAAKIGLTAKELADRNSPRFMEMAKFLNGSNDDFIRTSEPRHHKTCQALWQKIKEAGDIYLSKYSGWYAVRDEAYFSEDEISTDASGQKIGPTGSPVEWQEEESYFFRLSKYQEPLLRHYKDHPDFITPRSRYNEVVSFVSRGLKDLSISRSNLPWGVKVPDDPSHSMYVWLDALTNYISALDFPDDKDGLYARYWPAVHSIGKDIVRFHAVYWPAFLLSAGVPLPKRIVAHGHLLSQGAKMSKSVGNVIDPVALGRTFGVDAMRYFFLREVSYGEDGNYSFDAMARRINSDLANDLGNLAQRSLSMIQKNCEGKIPKPGNFSHEDKALFELSDGIMERSRKAMGDFALHQILTAIFEVVSEANRYFAAQQPWALKKSDPERMNTVLYVTAEIIRRVGIYLQPFMPEKISELLALVGVDATQGVEFKEAGEGGALKAGSVLPAPNAIFPRIELGNLNTDT